MSILGTVHTAEGGVVLSGDQRCRRSGTDPKTLIYRNYLILKRMAEEIASYPAQARVGILSPKIKPVPKTSIEHVERIETATEKYLIGTVTEIKKVLRLDYPILEINLWQGNPVKIMSFYLHCFSNFRKLFFYQF